jgi:hypothetical protein
VLNETEFGDIKSDMSEGGLKSHICFTYFCRFMQEVFDIIIFLLLDGVVVGFVADAGDTVSITTTICGF